MKFQSPLEELRHWLGMLAVDVALGVERRHLLSTARLCGVLIERIEAGEVPRLAQGEFQRLEFQLLDLQRAIAARTEPTKPQPRARRVGRLRLINGG